MQANPALRTRINAANGLIKKHMLERVVPAVASLKATLEEQQHWMQADALRCLVGLLREHTKEVEDILVTQRQLAAEIRFTVQVRATRLPLVIATGDTSAYLARHSKW